MMNSVKDFRGKIEPPVEKGVLKIERYAQKLTQGYSAYGGSYLWAPGYMYSRVVWAVYKTGTGTVGRVCGDVETWGRVGRDAGT